MIALLACDFLSVCGKSRFLSVIPIPRFLSPSSYVFWWAGAPGGGDLSCLMSLFLVKLQFWCLLSVTVGYANGTFSAQVCWHQSVLNE